MAIIISTKARATAQNPNPEWHYFCFPDDANLALVTAAIHKRLGAHRQYVYCEEHEVPEGVTIVDISRAEVSPWVTPAPTPPAEQQAITSESGAVYAELPEPYSTVAPAARPVWKAEQMRDFADRTHSSRLRCKSEQARLATLWGYVRADATTKQATPKAAPVTQQAGYAEVIECGNSYAKVKLKGEAFGSARVCDIFYTAPQQDEPVGEGVSASCDHATVRWLHQTSSVGGGDPRNSRAWPKVSGVSRDEGHSRALLVFFAAEPTDDEMRAVHDTLAAAPTAQAAPQQEAQEPTEIPEEIDRMAADRYKVVPSHESMFHRWAVVAGGTQQLYLGREVECQNMARKFAGAFLDGAFVAMQQAAPQPAPAAQGDAEDAARYQWLKSRASERLLNPRAALSEICPDMRTHWKLPTLMCSGPVGGYLDFDAAIDAGRKQGANHD